LNRQFESTLTASHASLFALESSIRNLSEFPLMVTSADRLALTDGDDFADDVETDSQPTLAVGDFHALSHSLETSR
jgi:hypothetical protein